MSLGAKKFDRYVLPVFSVITFLAGLGFACLIEWSKLANRKWATVLASSVVALLIIGQAGAWYSTLPYRLDYYNPIMGGSNQAQHVLQMGWGHTVHDVCRYSSLPPTRGDLARLARKARATKLETKPAAKEPYVERSLRRRLGPEVIQ